MNGFGIRFIEQYEPPKADEPMSLIDLAIVLASKTGTSVEDALAFLSQRRREAN